MIGTRPLHHLVLAFLGAHVVTFLLLFAVLGPLLVAEPEHDVVRTPLLVNAAASGTGQLTETLLFSRGVRVLAGDFGVDRNGHVIADELFARLPLSLALVGTLLLVVGMAALLPVATWVLAELKLRAPWRGAGFTIGTLVALVAVYWPAQWLVGAVWRFVRPGQLAEHAAGALLGLALIAGLGAGAWWVRGTWMPLWRGAAADTGRLLGLNGATVFIAHVMPGALRRGLGAAAGWVGGILAIDLMLETIFEVRGVGRYAVEAFHAADVAVLQVLILLGVGVQLLARLPGRYVGGGGAAAPAHSWLAGVR